MNVDDSIYHAVHDNPGGAAALAPRLGMSEAVLNSKVRVNCTSHCVNVRDLRNIVGFTNDLRPLHALAREFDHVMVQRATGEPASDMAVLEAVAALWADNGSLGQTVHHALADGRLTDAEMQGIRKAIYAAQGSLTTLLRRLENMAEPMPSAHAGYDHA